MKKTTIALLCAMLLPVYAEFNVKVPLERNTGGNLPVGSIQIGPQHSTPPSGPTPTPDPDPTPEPIVENWLPHDPLIGDWGVTSVTCDEWTPDPSKYDLGENFTQYGYECVINEARTIQQREIEENTNAIRNVGAPTNETRSRNEEEYTRIATGTRPACYANPTACFPANPTYVNECAFIPNPSMSGELRYEAYWHEYPKEWGWSNTIFWNSYMFGSNPSFGEVDYPNPDGEGIFYRGRYMEDVYNPYNSEFYGKIYEICYYGPVWEVGPY